MPDPGEQDGLGVLFLVPRPVLSLALGKLACFALCSGQVVATHLLQPPAGARGDLWHLGHRRAPLDRLLRSCLVPLPGQMDSKFIVLRSWSPSFCMAAFFSGGVLFFYFFLLNFKMGVPNLIKDSISWNEHF